MHYTGGGADIGYLRNAAQERRVCVRQVRRSKKRSGIISAAI
jgi:hypothetical protein